MGGMASLPLFPPRMGFGVPEQRGKLCEGHPAAYCGLSGAQKSLHEDKGHTVEPGSRRLVVFKPHPEKSLELQREDPGENLPWGLLGGAPSKKTTTFRGSWREPPELISSPS